MADCSREGVLQDRLHQLHVGVQALLERLLHLQHREHSCGLALSKLLIALLMLAQLRKSALRLQQRCPSRGHAFQDQQEMRFRCELALQRWSQGSQIIFVQHWLATQQHTEL